MFKFVMVSSIAFLGMFAAISDASGYDLFWILMGETQSGKTTLAQSFTDDNFGAVGTGDGLSTTTGNHVYTTAFGMDSSHVLGLSVMDTVGYLDVNLTIGDDDILNDIVASVLLVSKDAEKKGGDAILLLESLLNDNIQLTRNIDRLQGIFGTNIIKSIVVVGTKVEYSRMIRGEKRIDAVKELCAQLGVPFTTWSVADTNKVALSKEAMEEQKKRLVEVTKKVVPFEMDAIKHIQSEIYREACKLRDAAPPKMRSVVETYMDKCPETYKKKVTRQHCVWVKRYEHFLFFTSTYHERVCNPVVEWIDDVKMVDCQKTKTVQKKIEQSCEAFYEEAKEKYRQVLKDKFRATMKDGSQKSKAKTEL